MPYFKGQSGQKVFIPLVALNGSAFTVGGTTTARVTIDDNTATAGDNAPAHHELGDWAYEFSVAETQTNYAYVRINDVLAVGGGNGTGVNFTDPRDMYPDGAIYIDTVNGTTGESVFGVNGTPSNPVDALADALTIDTSAGFNRFVLLNNSDIALTAVSYQRYVFVCGENASINTSSATNTIGLSIIGGTVFGSTDGPINVSGCQIGDGTNVLTLGGTTNGSGLNATDVTMAQSTTAALIAGGTAPDIVIDGLKNVLVGGVASLIDMAGVASANLQILDLRGNITIDQVGNSVDVRINGDGVVTYTTVGGAHGTSITGGYSGNIEDVASPTGISTTNVSQVNTVTIRTAAKEAIDDKLLVELIESDIMIRSDIASFTSNTQFILTDGSPDNDAYIGATAVIVDASTAYQKMFGVVSDYIGSTKEVFLRTDPGVFTLGSGDSVTILSNTVPNVLGTPAGADVSADIAAVKVDTAAVLVDTGTTLPATLGSPAGADMSADIAAVKVDTAAVLVDTGTTIPASLTTIDNEIAVIDTEVGAIQADVTLIKVPTDKMVFTKTNELDVNTKSINDAEVVGDGNATPWDGV